MANIEILGGEGRFLEITVATGKEAREPKTYILLVVGQTIELLSHVTHVCMYVCVVITYSRVWINRVRLPILLVVS